MITSDNLKFKINSQIQLNRHMEQKRRITTQEIMNSHSLPLHITGHKPVQVVSFDQFCSGQVQLTSFTEGAKRSMSTMNTQQYENMSSLGKMSEINAQSSPSDYSNTYSNSQYENSSSMSTVTLSEKRVLKKKSKGTGLGKRKRQ